VSKQWKLNPKPFHKTTARSLQSMVTPPAVAPPVTLRLVFDSGRLLPVGAEGRWPPALLAPHAPGAHHHLRPHRICWWPLSPWSVLPERQRPLSRSHCTVLWPRFLSFSRFSSPLTHFPPLFLIEMLTSGYLIDVFLIWWIHTPMLDGF
jgi:hypothetical protein